MRSCFYNLNLFLYSVVYDNENVFNRMRTATSKFVTVFDVCVVVGACLCGAITGLIGRKFIQKINSNLRKVSFDLIFTLILILV